MSISRNVRFDNAQAAAVLFRAFARKMHPEPRTQHPTQQRNIDVATVIEKYCAENFNRDYANKTDRLNIGKVHVIVDVDHCAQVMEVIKTYAHLPLFLPIIQSVTTINVYFPDIALSTTSWDWIVNGL